MPIGRSWAWGRVGAGLGQGGRRLAWGDSLPVEVRRRRRRLGEEGHRRGIWLGGGVGARVGPVEAWRGGSGRIQPMAVMHRGGWRRISAPGEVDVQCWSEAGKGVRRGW